MPTETLDPGELELLKPLVGTKFRRLGEPYAVMGKRVIRGAILVRKDGTRISQWMDVRQVARLVRDQGGAT